MHLQRYFLSNLLAVICLGCLTVYAHAESRSCATAKDPNWCNQRLSWYNKELPKAQKGDYVAQREVSFCLSSGCSGAVAIDPVSACAWQNVIAVRKQGDATDDHNLKSACSGLSEEKRSEALTNAQNLLARMPGPASPAKQAPAIGF